MADKKCKYYNTGYCKFRDQCKFNHPSDICQENECKNKKCSNRHPRNWRYKMKCKRQTTCAYKHNKNVPYSDSKQLLNQYEKYIERLKAENVELFIQLKSADIALNEANEKLQNKCDECDQKVKLINNMHHKEKDHLSNEFEKVKLDRISINNAAQENIRSHNITHINLNTKIVVLKEALKNTINEKKVLEEEKLEDLEKYKSKYKSEKDRAVKYRIENFNLKNQQNCDKCYSRN